MTAKDINKVILVGGSSRIPYIQELVKMNLEQEPNKSVNPDEVRCKWVLLFKVVF